MGRRRVQLLLRRRISPRHVLTAGHCVYDSYDGGYADSIRFIPDQDGSHEPFGSATSTRLRVDPAYVRNEAFAYDYGLVTLGKSIGSKTKFFGYASYTNKTLQNKRFSSAGYPGDLSNGERMYVQSGKPLRSTTRRS